MQIFRLPGQFRRHMEQYENDKKEVSRKYRQQLKETTKQMYALNNHIMNTQIKFKTVNNKMDKIEENIKNDFKEHKNEIKEEIKKVNNKMDKLKEDVNDLEQNKNEIKEEIKKASNKMDKLKEDIKNDFKEYKNEIKNDFKEYKNEIKNDFKEYKNEIKNDLEQNKNEIKNDLEQNKNEIKNYVNLELNRSDKFMDVLQKQSRKQKQKFDNYKQQTNKRFNKIEQHIDKLNRDNSSLLDMLKCLIFGKNDYKKNDKQDYAANDSFNNFDLNKSFTSMNLRRTNSCFFSINTNDDDNRNNNSKNSFTVFNRKNDIIPNLEEKDIKENNNRLNNKNL